MQRLDRLLWSGWVRVPMFWIIAVGVAAVLVAMLPWLDLRPLYQIPLALQDLTTSHPQLDQHEHVHALLRLSAHVPWLAWGANAAAARIARPELAYALAYLIGLAGSGLLGAYVVMHALLVRWSMRGLRRLVKRYGSRREFAKAYDQTVYPRLEGHPLIGHAWKEFDETLLKGEQMKDGVIGNTVRPQSFVNYAVLRERLTGLKMLPSIAGYFVGVGLLLTFVGIVIALSIAAGSVSSGNADEMQTAMTDLLHAASFKFSTSIAGLAASIVFGIVSRFIVIWIEGGINRLCEAVERQLLYRPPQAITAEMNEVAKEQRDQLKELTSEAYFSRFGDVLEKALARVMEPMTGGITGVIREGAGAQIEQLGAALGGLQGAVRDMQDGLGRLDGALTGAAASASGQVESAMSGVLAKLDAQIEAFLGGLRTSGEAASREVAEARQQALQAQTAAREEIAAAGSEAAKALQEGLGDVVARISAEVARIEAAMQQSARAHEAQAEAIRQAATQTQSMAQAFSTTAGEVRGVVTPLAQTGQELGRASAQIGEAVARTASELDKASSQSEALASSLVTQVERLTAAWESYRDRFEKVDETLAKSIESLAAAAENQQATLSRYVTDIDQALLRAVGQLQPTIQAIGESTEELAETLEKYAPRAAEPAE